MSIEKLSEPSKMIRSLKGEGASIWNDLGQYDWDHYALTLTNGEIALVEAETCFIQGFGYVGCLVIFNGEVVHFGGSNIAGCVPCHVDAWKYKRKYAITGELLRIIYNLNYRIASKS